MYIQDPRLPGRRTLPEVLAGRDKQSEPDGATEHQRRQSMTAGKVSKLVSSYGSIWGRIRPEGEARELYFNPDALVNRADYSALVVGQDVNFTEEPDRANGTHAMHVSPKLLPLPVETGGALMTAVLWAVAAFVIIAAIVGVIAS